MRDRPLSVTLRPTLVEGALPVPVRPTSAPADDASVDALAVAATRGDVEAVGRPYDAWAFRIARNAVIDHQRRIRPTEPLAAIAEPSDGTLLETLSLRDEEIRELRTAIRSLTPDQQEAIALRYGAG